MKKVNFREKPLEIHGLPVYLSTGELRRFPDELVKQLPSISDAAKRRVGARLLFRTNSSKIKVEMKVENIYVDRGFSFYQANIGTVFIGERSTARFAGIVSADTTYESDTLTGEFSNDGMNDVTVYFPHLPTVTDINVFLDDSAEILPPSPFICKKTLLFYGSSITENGHCCSQNGYAELCGREFDAEYYNFGMSGVAKGELPMADYICSIDHQVFIYDYDHNAPDPQHLRNTHYGFYEHYRQKCPDNPVIMMSRPAWDSEDSAERLAIIRESYEKGLSAGDKNLYFIDGRTLFCGVPEAICTTDRTHPNDLGHYLMFKRVSEELRKIL